MKVISIIMLYMYVQMITLIILGLTVLALHLIMTALGQQAKLNNKPFSMKWRKIGIYGTQKTKFA